MDLETYQELTGNEVDSSEVAAVTAQIRRTKNTLETLLGYSLDKKKASINQYEEKGKAKVDCDLKGIIWGGDTLNDLELDPADEVEGSYRLFRYNKDDQYFEVDPYTTVYKVKLVYIKTGDEPNGITHKTFSDSKVRVQKTGNISKYIERCNECLCSCVCDDCVQLAVDADWLNESCLPEALLYVWADMVEFYSDPNRGVIEETLGTHRYKLAEAAAPETMDENMAVIKKYAGPNGSIHKLIAV